MKQVFFIRFYSGCKNSNDNLFALKLYKKYKSVRLYLKPNVPALTLVQPK